MAKRGEEERSAGRRLGRALGRFARAEDGVLMIFGLFVLLIMMMAAGLAVDTIRHERERARTQATLDRAVLAAADLQQTLTPQEVVADYFAKAGLSDRLGPDSVVVEERFNHRAVSATAAYDVPTMLLHMVGVDRLGVTTTGQAEEERGVEISLVLDLSNSMNGNNRLPRLKEAAKQFVDAVLSDPSDKQRVSISVVPFSSQVSTGPAILSKLNVSNEHNYANCVDFDDADFRTTAITATQPLKRAAYYDVFTSNYDPITKVICHKGSETDRWIMPFSSDAGALKARIDSFVAEGQTSIDIGTKWGAFLLDPTSRPVTNGEIAAGRANPEFAGRPFAYQTDGVAKVLVVMSDGDNWRHDKIKREYASGNSEIWRDPDDGRYSVRYWDAGLNKYQWFSAVPAGQPRSNTPIDNDGNPTNGVGDPVRLSYPELWSRVSLQAHAYLQGLAKSGQGDWFWRVNSTVSETLMDQRTQNICGAAKSNGVTVYTIGFEAPLEGNDLLRDCATSPAHFFDVEGLEIAEAFSTIASAVNQLRLTR